MAKTTNKEIHESVKQTRVWRQGSSSNPRTNSCAECRWNSINDRCYFIAINGKPESLPLGTSLKKELARTGECFWGLKVPDVLAKES